MRVIFGVALVLLAVAHEGRSNTREICETATQLYREYRRLPANHPEKLETDCRSKLAKVHCNQAILDGTPPERRVEIQRQLDNSRREYQVDCEHATPVPADAPAAPVTAPPVHPPEEKHVPKPQPSSGSALSLFMNLMALLPATMLLVPF